MRHGVINYDKGIQAILNWFPVALRGQFIGLHISHLALLATFEPVIVHNKRDRNPGTFCSSRIGGPAGPNTQRSYPVIFI